MTKLFILLALSCLSLCSVVCAQTASTNGEDETYRVYDTVIRTMIAGVKLTFNTRVKQVVIRQDTTTDYAIADRKEDWPEIKMRLPKLSDEAIADYEANLKPSSTLKRSFDLSLKYSLVSKRDFNINFDVGSNSDQMTNNWTKFYDSFPDSGGYIQLSNVGFNKSRDQALVYLVHWCGTTCGTGHYVLLSKKDKVWIVNQVAMIWIS
jgi:hypothetical protein